MNWGDIVGYSIFGGFALIVAYGVIFDWPDREADQLSVTVLIIFMVVMGIGLYVGHLPQAGG